MKFLKRTRVYPEEELFNRIVNDLCAQNADVTAGPMMSSPGVKYKGRVFAFYHDRKMCFKLGKDVEPADLGIVEWEPLSPFKTKPPLAGWFYVPTTQMDLWDELASMALAKMHMGS